MLLTFLTRHCSSAPPLCTASYCTTPQVPLSAAAAATVVCLHTSTPIEQPVYGKWMVVGSGTLSTCRSVARIRWVRSLLPTHPVDSRRGAIEGILWNLTHSSCIHQSIPEPRHPVDSPIMLLSASCRIPGKLPLVPVCLLRLTHCYHRTGHPLHFDHGVIPSWNFEMVHGKNRQDSILFGQDNVDFCTAFLWPNSNGSGFSKYFFEIQFDSNEFNHHHL